MATWDPPSRVPRVFVPLHRIFDEIDDRCGPQNQEPADHRCQEMKKLSSTLTCDDEFKVVWREDVGVGVDGGKIFQERLAL